jgi:short-subunit dehydrogenase
VRVEPRTVVVVTGASSGVGRAVARLCGARGASVALIARSAGALAAAAAEVEAAGGRALVLEADVADHDAVERAAAEAESRLGPLDAWVNVAMATVLSPFEQITPAEFRRATEVTYLGYVHGTMAALRRMRPRDRGTVVQVGSALAYRPIPLQSAYCGAKHAIRGFTDALRCELLAEGSGVTVTAVHLPAVNTPQFDVVRSRMARKPRPVAPVYQPELAARAIVHAVEHPRRELRFGVMTVLAIAGNRVAPALLDAYLARTGARSQLTPVAETPRPDNLFRPVPGDRGAHGRFDGEAHARSTQLELTLRRDRLAAAAGLGALTLVARRLRRAVAGTSP